MPDASGETNVPIEDWTTGTLKIYHDEKIALLKEYVGQRFIDQDKAVQAALLATKEAIQKAETATEKRFDSVNEFRAQLADQSNTLMPRQEYSVQHKALEDRVTDLNDRMNKVDGAKEGSQVTIGKIYAAIAAVGVILGIVIMIANNVI